MATKTARLTDADCRNAKPSTDGKKYALADGQSLFLTVMPSGGKLWHYRYRFHGKPNILSIGTYPTVSLKEARKKLGEAKELLSNGKDPNQLKRQERIISQQNAANSFELVAREWCAKFAAVRTEGTSQRNLQLLENNAFPWLGARAISDIKAIELLAVLKRAEDRGVLETAHRLRGLCSLVFRYGVATGRCEHDIAADLKGALTPRIKKPMAAIIDPLKFGQLLRDIWAYQGQFVTLVAFKLSALFGLRPGEIRRLEWAEIDTATGLISIPMGKMKARRLHIIPLCQQAIELLETLRPLTGHGQYCFPGLQSKDRPMSENTINAALRRMGYDTKEDHTAHGFRSTFSTLAHGSGLWRKEVVEIQLAHRHGNDVELAYNRGNYLEERRQLMQWWANECDKMRQGAEVIPLPQRA